MEQEKWYLRTSVVVIALLSVGPLALPLVWLNSKFKAKNKILITIVVSVLSYFLFIWTKESFKALSNYYQQLF
jgi:hypothetical protein